MQMCVGEMVGRTGCDVFIVQEMRKLHAEAEKEFDMETIRCKLMESFKQTEVEINEQVSTSMHAAHMYIPSVSCSSVPRWRGNEQR